MKLLALLLLAVAVAAYDRKCFPAQARLAFYGKLGQTKDGQSMLLDIQGVTYQDQDKNMSASNQTVTVNGYTFTQMVFVNNNLMYVVQNGTCNKIPNPIPLPRLCNDSPGVMPLGSMMVGGYNLDTYEVKLPNFGTFTMTVERESFTLLNSVSVQTVMGYAQMTAIQYGNYSYDPIPASVFKLPALCNK